MQWEISWEENIFSSLNLLNYQILNVSDFLSVIMSELPLFFSKDSHFACGFDHYLFTPVQEIHSRIYPLFFLYHQFFSCQFPISIKRCTIVPNKMSIPESVSPFSLALFLAFICRKIPWVSLLPHILFSHELPPIKLF